MRIEESIAQRSQRPQRGIKIGDPLLSEHRGFWVRTMRIEESIAQRPHRSQRLKLWGSAFCEDLASVRELRVSKRASHGGHRGHKGGLKIIGIRFS